MVLLIISMKSVLFTYGHAKFIFGIFAESNVKETFRNKVVLVVLIVKPVLFCALIVVPFYFIVVSLHCLQAIYL